jgi:tetraacyldisaccharide 4'-kinase
VLVSTDRYLAGRLAEQHFDCSIHVLDDGFQHLQLDRDVDLVMLGASEVEAPRTLPRGRLREPFDAIARADAVLLTEASPAAEARVRALGVARVFHGRAAHGPFRTSDGRAIEPGPPALVLAGIARPERFARHVRAAGWHVAAELAFPDHHPYSARDLRRIAHQMQTASAAIVLTTEKDLVRLLPLRPLPFPVAVAPFVLGVEPAAEFRTWLCERLRFARETGARARPAA